VGDKSLFTHCGWRNWNRDNALDKQVCVVDSAHNETQERYNSYLTRSTAIDNRIVNVGSEEKSLYKIHLTYTTRKMIYYNTLDLLLVLASNSS
jgi:hypothetical protein